MKLYCNYVLFVASMCGACVFQAAICFFLFPLKYILIVVQTIVCVKKTRVDRCNAACAVMQLICYS